MGGGGELKVVLGPVREKNVAQLKLLNQAIFPVRYQVRGEALPPRPVGRGGVGCMAQGQEACHGSWRGAPS